MGSGGPASATPPHPGDVRLRWLTALCVASSLLVGTSTARAVDPAAELLFQEGRRLLLDDRLEEACARFTQSFAVEASSGTLLNLALCNEKLGKTATALSQYRQSARLARSQERADRAAAALQKADALELTVARLTLVAAEALGDRKVLLDGGTVRDSDLGVPQPVDPGPHEVLASAPGRRPWQVAIDIKEGERQTLQIPALELDAPAEAPVARVERSAALEPSRPPASKAELYLAAGGGLLFAAGGVIWAVAVNKFDAAQSACNSSPGCSADDRQARVSTIQGLEIAAFGTWLAAGGILAGAAVHHFWGRPNAPKVLVTPTTSGGAEVSLGGAF